MKNKFDENNVTIHQKINISQWILEIEEKDAKEPSDENKQRLHDLKQIKKRVENVNIDQLTNENNELELELKKLSDKI